MECVGYDQVLTTTPLFLFGAEVAGVFDSHCGMSGRGEVGTEWQSGKGLTSHGQEVQFPPSSSSICWASRAASASEFQRSPTSVRCARPLSRALYGRSADATKRVHPISKYLYCLRARSDKKDPSCSASASCFAQKMVPFMQRSTHAFAWKHSHNEGPSK